MSKLQELVDQLETILHEKARLKRELFRLEKDETVTKTKVLASTLPAYYPGLDVLTESLSSEKALKLGRTIIEKQPQTD